MTRLEFLQLLEEFAGSYCRADVEASVLRNRHLNDLTGNEQISKRVYDAIIVDFINYAGVKFCVDYELHTRDLVVEKLKYTPKSITQ